MKPLTMIPEMMSNKMIAAIIALILVGAISKAVMDKIQFHFSSSIFKDKHPMFWDPRVSWKNKWKEGDYTQGEKFWLSSTVLVFLTDAWHLFQGIFLTAIFLVPIFYIQVTPWKILDFILMKALFTGTFELFFGYIFKSKGS